MKLARVQVDNQPRAVIVREDGAFVDAAVVIEPWLRASGMDIPNLDLFTRTITQMDVASLYGLIRDTMPADAVEQAPPSVILPADTPLLCPIPRPNRILAIGRNYAEHARELGNAVPDEPVVFLKASTSVIGPNRNIEIPPWVGRVDYEAELLVVIGMGGKNISEAGAMEHVAGYSVFNDVTARDKQRAAQEKKHPWFLAKSLDTFGPLGPYFVSRDEIPDPHNLRVTLSVNGEIRQNDTTASMLHSIPSLIAYLSRWMGLEPGDVIATGTPSGVGPLVPDDIVEATIAGLGTLRNTVVGIS